MSSSFSDSGIDEALNDHRLVAVPVHEEEEDHEEDHEPDEGPQHYVQDHGFCKEEKETEKLSALGKGRKIKRLFIEGPKCCVNRKNGKVF